jgi:hypothetical protein
MIAFYHPKQLCRTAAGRCTSERGPTARHGGLREFRVDLLLGGEMTEDRPVLTGELIPSVAPRSYLPL